MPTGWSAEAKNMTMFQTSPDTTICEDFISTRCNKTLSPEKKLMVAVMQDAISYLKKPDRARSEEGKAEAARLRAEALRWILNEDERYLFSFNNICEELGMDPARTRKALIHGHGTDTAFKRAHYRKVTIDRLIGSQSRISRWR
ncbi:MAG: hypothetical protein WD688_12350 [Candidatus Binatia bacterium]